MKSEGIWSNKPHPSPVFPSAAIPPRCVIQVRDSMAVCRSLWLATPCWWAIMPKPQLSRNSSGLYKPRTSLVVPTVAFTMPDDFMSELARLIKLGLDAMNAQSQKGRTVYTSGPLSTICVTAKRDRPISRGFYKLSAISDSSRPGVTKAFPNDSSST